MSITLVLQLQLTFLWLALLKKQLKIIQDNKSSKPAGVHELTEEVLEDGADTLAKSVPELCSLSISRWIFPSNCTELKLKPIFRKWKKPDPSNYRVTYLLPVISKIINTVVNGQTNAFLSDEKILFNYQSGFRGNHSRNSCLFFLTDVTVYQSFWKNFLWDTAKIFLISSVAFNLCE